MILSLLTDESLIQDKNITEGYNLFTGSAYDNNPHNNHYGEIHTGDALKSALNRFCGNEGVVMSRDLATIINTSNNEISEIMSYRIACANCVICSVILLIF